MAGAGAAGGTEALGASRGQARHLSPHPPARPVLGLSLPWTELCVVFSRLLLPLDPHGQLRVTGYALAETQACVTQERARSLAPHSETQMVSSLSCPWDREAPRPLQGTRPASGP